MQAVRIKPAKTLFSKQQLLFSTSFREKRGQFLESRLLHTLLVSLVTIALVFFVRNHLPPELPLFYGLPSGEEQLTTKLGLIIPSLTSIAIIFINFGLSQGLRDSYFRRILSLASLASVFFSTITTVKIIFLVGSF
ncbi:hypothetical protein IID22_00175 [Patescibacteria group bacterium]|nr:hypothetical protein [Patescibacteria group bacterium]